MSTSIEQHIVPLLKWSSLTKSFGRQSLFKDLSGELIRQTTTVVTGPNGSGKSTFLRVICGLTAPDSGEVVRSQHHGIGYCSPSMELYGELTGLENLQFFARVSGIELGRCRELLGDVGLTKSTHKLYSAYSSGMKQRLKLAFSLLNSPSILILDEPTIALDSDGTQIVDRLISRHKAGGGSAIIATNVPTEAERWADTVISLHK